MSLKSVFVFAHSGSYAKPFFKINGVNGICIDLHRDDGNHVRTINNIREMIRSLTISHIHRRRR